MKRINSCFNAGSPEMPHKLVPYKEIPFSPEKLELSQPSPQKYSYALQKLQNRKIINHKIEHHFSNKHQSYKNKQNNHNSRFKIKVCKKKANAEINNDLFWKTQLQPRQKAQRSLYEQYLKNIKDQFIRRQKWSQTEGFMNKEDKLISEYNMQAQNYLRIYEYRTEKIKGIFPQTMII